LYASILIKLFFSYEHSRYFWFFFSLYWYPWFTTHRKRYSHC